GAAITTPEKSPTRCPACGQSSAPVTPTPPPDAGAELKQTITEEILPSHPPEEHDERAAEEAKGGLRLPDLPSLKKPPENDEAGRRTRAINRVIVAVVGCSAFIGLCQGQFLTYLYLGVVFGAVAGFVYGLLIHPGRSVSAGEELARKRRKARRSRSRSARGV